MKNITSLDDNAQKKAHTQCECVYDVCFFFGKISCLMHSWPYKNGIFINDLNLTEQKYIINFDILSEKCWSEKKTATDHWDESFEKLSFNWRKIQTHTQILLLLLFEIYSCPLNPTLALSQKYIQQQQKSPNHFNQTEKAILLSVHQFLFKRVQI